VIYFEHPDGRIIIAPESIDTDYSHARKSYDLKYSNEGWMWREAGTLSEVDALQKRLCELEQRRIEKMIEVDDSVKSRIRQMTSDVLFARMASSSTSPWERDFIKSYLQLRDDKRSKYQQRLLEHNSFIYAREYDSRTNPEDLIV
jgi:hypothetical protein